MLKTVDLRAATTPEPVVNSRTLLGASLCLALCILYQIYFYDFQDGVITGGELQRLILKVLFTGLFFASIGNYLSLSVLGINLFLKIPLLFIAATIGIVAPFLASDYTQALNLFFFLPILLIDWNKPGGARLYRTIWAIIATVVCIQLALDPVFKFYFKVQWSNAAFVGGVGNPNVFGVFLIAAGLACSVLLRGAFRYFSTLLFIATVLTGSLASALVGIGCVVLQMLLQLSRSPARALLITGVAIAAVSASTAVIELASDSESITHAFEKLVDLSDVVLNGSSDPGSASISIRRDYTNRGMEMLAESPFSLLTGHPDATPMYSGDGAWVAFVVTYGLPVTLFFIVANAVLIWRGLASPFRDQRFSACILTVFMVFFVTNRILDYWPAALLYLLAFAYLATHGVYRRAAAANEGNAST